MTKVAVIIGSESDAEHGEKVARMLDEFGVPHELNVISAHRSPDRLASYVENSGADVYICVAGLAAALPGAVAARTVKPVIGVPKDVKLGGLDSLLSIVQMPTGVPVATVAIDGAVNAALLAVEILALSDERLEAKLHEYREKRAKG
jgi:5-(carboxyamino)imidazole ribonucleotide mutase